MKGHVALVVILAGLVLVSGCADKGNVQAGQNPGPTVPAEVAKAQSQTENSEKPKPQSANDCLKAYGYTDPKITMANVTMEYTNISRCIIKLAVDGRNPSICDVEGWSGKAECRDHVALEEKVDRAAGLQDLGLCDVNGWDYKYDCQERIYAKFGKCLDPQLTPPVRKVTCFSYMAIQKNDATLCDGIKGIDINGWQGQQAFCYNYFAMQKKDYRNTCEKIAPIAVSSRDWFAIRMANQCYYDWAKIDNDESICGKILADTNEGMEYADGCYGNVGAAKKDAGICGKIKGKEDTRECYYRVAVDTNNSSLCGKIPDGENEVGWNRKLMCYSDLSVNMNDESICDKLGDLKGMPSGDSGSGQSLKYICHAVFESKTGKSQPEPRSQ